MRAWIFSLGLLISGTMRAAEPTVVEHLAVFLTGSFANADQARGDQNFRSTVLHVAPIWTDLKDGPWLYGEQALADAPDHPFRQFIYRLGARPGQQVEIQIFDLPDPIAATGSWREPARLNQLRPDQLIPRPGCNVLLEMRAGGTFHGETQGTACASSLRGASFSRMEMTVSNLEITTWERGFNAAGAQVWGSVHGGYRFKRAE